MLHKHRDFSFGWLVEPLKSGLEKLNFFDIAKLEPYDSIVVFAILGGKEIAHCPRNRRTKSLKPKFHIYFFLGLEHPLELVEQTHSGLSIG